MNEDTPRLSLGSRFVKKWRAVGGGSLTLSVAIHLGILLFAGAVVVSTQMIEKQVDFLPGGGSQQGAAASAEMRHKVQQKKRSQLNKVMPMKKIVTTNMNSEISLPDAPLDLLDVPDMSSLLGGGSLGSGGFGKAGAGGGFGTGLGRGGMGGVTFKPIMMFGMELKDTRKIAVVMDVSRSMTKYLPIVAKELDKVAFGSPLVLYFGCGLQKPPRGMDDKVRKAQGDEFARFWQHWQGKASLRMTAEERKNLVYDPEAPMPLPAVYEQMIKRSNTYFIDFNGITYTSSALMSKEVMEADTIYWFADFQDRVDEAHMEEVRKKLKSRKQKLYIHASIRGRSFEQVRDKLVLPLGGEVIETKAE